MYALWRPYHLLLPMRLNTKGLRIPLVLLAICLSTTSLAHSHGNHNQVHLESTNHSSPVIGPTWVEKFGPQIDLTFSGPLSFSHLPYVRCLQEESTDFDIAILGLPFDTGVSHRPG
jgi:agmatinase